MTGMPCKGTCIGRRRRTPSSLLHVCHCDLRAGALRDHPTWPAPVASGCGLADRLIWCAGRWFLHNPLEVMSSWDCSIRPKLRICFWKRNKSTRLARSTRSARFRQDFFLCANLHNLPRICIEMAFSVLLRVLLGFFGECRNKGT